MPRKSLDSARNRPLSIKAIFKIQSIYAELVEACRGRDSNSHTFWAYAPQAYASASSATAARADYIIYILYIHVKEIRGKICSEPRISWTEGKDRP